jgi:hypothetical protein
MKRKPEGVARIVMMIILLLFPGSCSRSSVSSGPDPGAVVVNFYSLYRNIDSGGIPQPADLQKLEPMFTTRLRSLLDEARQYQAAYARTHPMDKPPFIDGDLFSSNFEGFKTSSLGAVKRLSGDTYRVEVHLSYWDPSDTKTVVKWTDAVRVVREQGKLLIDDFEFLADWPFAQKGRLSDILQSRS